MNRSFNGRDIQVTDYVPRDARAYSYMLFSYMYHRKFLHLQYIFVRSGATTSLGTGPDNAALDGRFYMYTEASGRVAGDEFMWVFS